MSFAASLAQLCALEQDKLHKTCRAIVIALFSEVIQRTPILTGRLASNWLCSMDAPSVSTVGNFGKDNAKSEAVRGVVELVVRIGGDFVIFLTNNLPYAKRVEYEGWSTVKAPAGMVGITMARIHAIVEQKVRDVAGGRQSAEDMFR